MTKITYTIHPEGDLWRVEAGGKPMKWFYNKHSAKDWLDAQEALGDRDDIVKELRALRFEGNLQRLVIACMISALCLFVAGSSCLRSPEPPPPPPPETQQHGLDLPHTPVVAAASRGSDYGPCRREPVCQTLAQTSERPGPGRDDRALPEWISLGTRGPGWGPQSTTASLGH